MEQLKAPHIIASHFCTLKDLEGSCSISAERLANPSESLSWAGACLARSSGIIRFDSFRLLAGLTPEGWRTRSPFACSCQPGGAVHSSSHPLIFLGALLDPHSRHCIARASCALSLSDLRLHSLVGESLKRTPLSGSGAPTFSLYLRVN